MNLEEIFERRLLVVSGKGGVGKTSVAASLGLLAARQGKKTLIAEVNAAERISQLFGLKPIGYQETRLAENLFAINIDARSAFEEYILEQIHSKKIYHLVFENRFVRSFLDATPGLNELLEIGKIWALTERDKDETGLNPKYDLVIVDAPATGHGLALLDVPRVVTSAVRVGPLKNKAKNVMDLVQNPKKTLMFIVTLAEEMPINEALEILQAAKTQIKVATAPVVANGLFPHLLSDPEWQEIRTSLKSAEKEEWFIDICQAVNVYQKRVRLQRFYLNKLKMGLGNEILVEIPYLFRSPFNRVALEEISEYLQRALTQKNRSKKSRRQ